MCVKRLDTLHSFYILHHSVVEFIKLTGPSDPFAILKIARGLAARQILQVYIL